MRLKDRMDIAWALVLKHKGHYFGGFATFVVMAIISVSFGIPSLSVATLMGYLVYSVVIDIYVLDREGLIEYETPVDRVKDTPQEPMEEDEPWDEDTWDEPQDDCEEPSDYDCDYSEEGACDEPYDGDERL